MPTIRNTLFYPFLLISLLFFFTAPVSSAQDEAPQSILSSIRYWKDPNYIRIVIDLSSPVTFQEKYLPNPDRLFIDIHNTRIATEINPIHIGDGVVTQVRTGQHDKETVRVVIDLSAKAGYKILPLTSPDRLVIDILRDSAPPVSKIEPKIEKESNNDIITARQTIVIDPGHGGKDPGAIGKSGLREKDIVLDVGLRLRKLIKERLGANVILTDLMNTAKKEESLRLAYYVQENMIGHLEKRYKVTDLGVKQAPFYVLVNARMPSILAEIRNYIHHTHLLPQQKEQNFSSLP